MNTIKPGVDHDRTTCSQLHQVALHLERVVCVAENLHCDAAVERNLLHRPPDPLQRPKHRDHISSLLRGIMLSSWDPTPGRGEHAGGNDMASGGSNLNKLPRRIKSIEGDRPQQMATADRIWGAALSND